MFTYFCDIFFNSPRQNTNGGRASRPPLWCTLLEVSFKEVKKTFFCAADIEKNVLLTFFMIQTILISLITLVQL